MPKGIYGFRMYCVKIIYQNKRIKKNGTKTYVYM